MKIHKIHFKNINSLAGEHIISFDQPPLSDVGVFAITGPNGSGKTTILDAITLALYGQTYRFDTPARHVMTQLTEECFSEVEFSINEQHYRSSWKASRGIDPSGKPHIGHDMRLVRIVDQQEAVQPGEVPEAKTTEPGEVKQEQENVQQSEEKLSVKQEVKQEEVLGEKSNIVRSAIDELTGMDFRRFTRSIILAQGDFAAFLNALDSERMDMLENIISADVYEDYKHRVYQQADDEQDKLKQLQQEQVAILLLDNVKLEAYELDLADFKEQARTLGDEKNDLQQKLNWLHSMDTSENKIKAWMEREQQILQNIDREQQTQDEINAKQDFQKHQEQVSEIDNKLQTLAGQTATRESHVKELGQLDRQITALGGADQATDVTLTDPEQLKESIDTLSFQLQQIKQGAQKEKNQFAALQAEYREKETVRSDTQYWLDEHQADKMLVDDFPDLNRLLELKAALQEQEEKKKAFLQWKKTTGSLIKKNQAGFEKIKKNIRQLKNKKLVYEEDLKDALAGRSIEEISGLREDLQDRVVQFRELLNLANEHQSLEKKTGGMFVASTESMQTNVDELREKYTQMTDVFVREQNIKSSLDKAVFHEGWLKKHEKEREYLEFGQPCPLCGSLKHPYVIQPPAPSDSKRALVDQTRKVKELQGTLDRLKRQIAQAEKVAQVRKEKEDRMVTIRSRWLTTCSRLNTVDSKLEISRVGYMKKKLKLETDELQTISSLEKEIRGLESKIADSDSMIEKQEALLKQLQERNSQLDADWERKPEEEKDIDLELERCQREEKTFADKINDQLNKLGETMAGTGNEDELIERLNARKKDFQVYTQRKVNLVEELGQFQEKAKASQERSNTLENRLQRCQERLQKEETARLLILKHEKEKQITEMGDQVKETESELARLQDALLREISVKGCDTLEQLREILALLATRGQVENRLTALQKDSGSLSAEIQQEKDKLTAARALALTELSEGVLQERKKSVVEKIDINRQEISHLDAILSENRHRQQTYDKLTEKIELQQKTCNECAAEIKKIEDNGRAFRISVQQMMVDRLLDKANQFLGKISGRFHVHKKASEQGLALEIEDTYQENIRRLPKSLSGGESFVVSLSLALSLSEQANNGKSVDSLFLDEGFGYLDEESLYMVMTTLKGLKAHGKTVGVISHVKGVMDRIDTRIEMTREPNGLSRFEFLY